MTSEITLSNYNLLNLDYFVSVSQHLHSQPDIQSKGVFWSLQWRAHFQQSKSGWRKKERRSVQITSTQTINNWVNSADDGLMGWPELTHIGYNLLSNALQHKSVHLVAPGNLYKVGAAINTWKYFSNPAVDLDIQF